MGRAAANTLVLDLPKVSRMHALIQLQNIGEFWLVDLGSSNGTFLNKRRVHQPVRLHDQDKILIGGRQFIFRQPEEISPDYQTTIAERTIQEIENAPCWLLVADIVGAQALAEPRFRFVVHFGLAAIGGVTSLGEES